MRKSPIKVADGKKLEHPLRIKIEVEAELWGAPELSTHRAVFLYADCVCDVTDDAGKRIGGVGGGMGGTTPLYDDNKNLCYAIMPDDLWRAFQKALAEQIKST